MRTRGLIVLLVWCGACGGSDGMPLDDYLEQEATSWCEHLVECGDYADVSTCLDHDGYLYWYEQLAADVEAGLVRYDGTDAAACIEWEGSLSCEWNQDYSGFSACEDLFTGTVPPGGECWLGYDCMANSYCDFPDTCGIDTCCAGTCSEPYEILAEGADCSGDGVCIEGTYCISGISGMPRTCEPYGSDGEPCYAADGCVTPLACLGLYELDATMGTCGAATASGEICNPDDAPNCADQRDYCDATTGHCERRVEPGGSCANSALCVDYAQCDFTDYTCVAYGGLGDPCEFSFDCLGVLYCDETTMLCAYPPPVCSE